MDDDGPAGAEAAAKYFLALDAYIQVTGDTMQWDAMSHSECEFCAKRRDQARQLTESHYTFTGGETRTSVLHTYSQDTVTGIWPIDVEVTVEETSVTDPAGSVIFSSGKDVSKRRVEVAKQNGEWVVVGVGLLDGN